MPSSKSGMNASKNIHADSDGQTYTDTKGTTYTDMGIGQKKSSQSGNVEQRQWHKLDSYTDQKKSHLILNHD